MKEITSVNNEYIKYLKSLKDKKNRDLKNEFLLEGYHLVNEAKKANLLKTVLITNVRDEVDGVSNILVTDSILHSIAQTKTPQGIIGVASYFDTCDITGNKFLLLDNLQDPGNVGTLIRSALGFGIDQVIISNDSVDIYNDKLIRSTQGAIFNISILKRNLQEVVELFKKNGVTIIGTALNGIRLKEVKDINKYALILGNEGTGVSNQLLKLSDINVRIEMNNKLESLNVSVAGSIIMHYLA